MVENQNPKTLEHAPIAVSRIYDCQDGDKNDSLNVGNKIIHSNPLLSSFSFDIFMIDHSDSVLVCFEKAPALYVLKLGKTSAVVQRYQIT